MTIAALRKKFLEGTATPTDAVEASREVIARADGDVHAYLDLYDEAVDEAARATETYRMNEGASLSLLGVPLAVKNNILVKGKRATGGSKILEHYTATYDATIVKRLRAAGAILIGSTNLDEFAMGSSTENSAFGPTKNPHDLSRVPGGSSGGSAAAVAMGSVPAAIGTDTGGSIRQPASYCGLVGLKPTYGAVSRYGLMAMGSSLDQAGPLTTTVADAELLHRVMQGTDPLDATTIEEDTYPSVGVQNTYTIGVPYAFLKDGIDADVRERFEAHIEALQASGHTVVDVSLPLLEKGLAAYYIVMRDMTACGMALVRKAMTFSLNTSMRALRDSARKRNVVFCSAPTYFRQATMMHTTRKRRPCVY